LAACHKFIPHLNDIKMQGLRSIWNFYLWIRFWNCAYYVAIVGPKTENEFMVSRRRGATLYGLVLGLWYLFVIASFDIYKSFKAEFKKLNQTFLLLTLKNNQQNQLESNRAKF